MKGERPAAATVDLAALAANYRALLDLAGGRELIAVVKADAYGHGAEAVARRLVASGCRHLAVLSVAEAAALREAGIEASILVLGGVHDPAEAEAAAAWRVVPVVHDAAQLPWLERAGEAGPSPLPVQVEVDTGMHRMGIALEEALARIEEIAASPSLALAGIYTHLACAEELDPAPTEAQLERFRSLLEAVRARGLEPGQVHVANSAALLAARARGADWLLGNAVRPGLALYGVVPAPHLAHAPLQPVMTLRTRVVKVKPLAAGDAVGYGATYRASRPHAVATLALGYADGLPWRAGNRGVVLLRGQRRRILGRVSMDFASVETGADPIELGDEAILFGVGAGGRLPVEEVAAALGTIPYELLVRVGARVPRVVIG